MLHRTNQWDINILNCKLIVGSILVGVGGAPKQIGIQGNFTKRFCLINIFIV